FSFYLPLSQFGGQNSRLGGKSHSGGKNRVQKLSSISGEGVTVAVKLLYCARIIGKSSRFKQKFQFSVAVAVVIGFVYSAEQSFFRVSTLRELVNIISRSYDSHTGISVGERDNPKPNLGLQDVEGN